MPSGSVGVNNIITGVLDRREEEGFQIRPPEPGPDSGRHDYDKGVESEEDGDGGS